MSEQWWLIKDDEGNERQVLTDGRHPSEAGENVEGKQVKQLARRGNFEVEKFDWQTENWVADLGPLRQREIDKLQLLREKAQSHFLTPGECKKMLYAEKQHEVAFFELIKDSLTPAKAAKLLPVATAQSKKTGQTVPQVIAEFSDGIAASLTKVADIEAEALKRKKMITDATTPEAIRAVNQTNLIDES